MSSISTQKVQSKDETLELATFLSQLTYQELPREVIDQAKWCILNILGCALGSSDASPHRKARAALDPKETTPAQGATVWGRPERADLQTAAILNGIAATTADYDDAHLRTVIHPSCTSIAAVLPWAEIHHVSGKEVILAFVAAVEAQCAIGMAVSPSSYANGWHITGLTGSFSGAAGAAKLLHLPPHQFAAALGHASSMASGTRAMFGTDTKTLHAGLHASNGILAAQLAKTGFASCEAPIEAWARLVSTTNDNSQIGALARGGPWQILENGFKPYPCGIVIHPLIDACLELFSSFNQAASLGGPAELEDIAGIQVTANPQLIRLCNVRHPRTGLETIFSLYHGCAVALVHGRAGPAEFSDAVAADDLVVRRVRDLIEVQTDPEFRDDEAQLVFISRGIALAGGASTRRTIYVKHATGSVGNPMTKAQLEEKFLAQATGCLGMERAKEAMEACWTLDSIDDVSDFAKLFGL